MLVLSAPYGMILTSKSLSDTSNAAALSFDVSGIYHTTTTLYLVDSVHLVWLMKVCVCVCVMFIVAMCFLVIHITILVH